MTEDSEVPSVRVLPSDISFNVQPGMTVFQAAETNGIWWPTLCNGSVECTRCYMEVLEGEEFVSPMDETERKALDRVRWQGGPPGQERLACCAKINGDILVRRRSVRVREDADKRKEP
ncbi:2Fe-2S iron-sulfur cluster-binding protein [Arthrobacter nitrophenolicus]|uniref:Ferredoxin n=1 Tax=Arthrobacter nitrophenolicus TaxID=683150 RepID=L8TNA0_9MICC|nr:ferredoxin [Arthrobacter nitrophenolicus]